jgi:hypothetical protein
MSEQDDQDWFDLLAGRHVPNASAIAQQEAALLRQAITAHRQDSAESDGFPEHDLARELMLINRASIAINNAPENRMPAQPRSVADVFGNWRYGWRPGFAFATLVAIVALVYTWLPIQLPDNQPDIVRGGGPTVYARQVGEPERVSRELADTLFHAGIKVMRRHEGYIWYVEFDMPDTPAPNIVLAMERIDVTGLRAGPTMIVLEMQR